MLPPNMEDDMRIKGSPHVTLGLVSRIWLISSLDFFSLVYLFLVLPDCSNLCVALKFIQCHCAGGHMKAKKAQNKSKMSHNQAMTT